MAYSLTPYGGSAQQLGTIIKERVSCDAQLFEQPLPTEPAKSSIFLDLFGVRKDIVLEGVFINGTGSKTIKQFVDQFIDNETGLLDGSQVTCAYVSDTFTDSINVMVKSFNYTYEEGDVSKVKYTLTLGECAQVTS